MELTSPYLCIFHKTYISVTLGLWAQGKIQIKGIREQNVEDNIYTQVIETT
jgi:hypothetical protein